MRLDQLADRLGDTISIEWKAFILRPEPKAPDQARFVEYTRSWLRPARMEPAASFRVWATDNAQPSHSLPAHAAAKTVATLAPEAAEDFHRRLLSAYFSENRTISEWSVLADLAEDVGVSGDDMVSSAREHEIALTKEIIGEHNDAITSGITAVPTVVIDDVLPVPGAQDVDVYETWIRRLIDRRAHL